MYGKAVGMKPSDWWANVGEIVDILSAKRYNV